jgi:hypothetical protein
VRYHADNIVILSFDKNGNLQWNNVISKEQFDDDTDDLISYQLMNTGVKSICFLTWRKEELIC